MPSPVAHAMGGLATAWIADIIEPERRSPTTSKLVDRLGGPLAVTSAVLAAVPDVDLIIPGAHRTATHSFFAAFIVGVIAASVAKRKKLPALRTGLVCGLAWASHVVFDWLGSDHSTPRGVMALWPFDHGFYFSPIWIFPTVEHRFWLVERFLIVNSMAFLWEVVLMGGVLSLIWRWRAKGRQSVMQPAPTPD
jgi:membrane-bound metal-dependent hydrolase YbcI (DUF457 family)